MFIQAKFKSTCAETGKPIAKGSKIFWSKATGKVYCESSEKYQSERDATNVKSYVQAQEDAYFDNWYSNNY